MIYEVWQSQSASATLRNIFEKHFRRGQKIELFSWPGIDFLPDFGNFPVSDPGQTHLNFADTPKISIFRRKNDE